MRCLRSSHVLSAGLIGLASLPFGCTDDEAVSLTATESSRTDISPPSADGPLLGITANQTPVFALPTPNAQVIGLLHAGAKVPRTEQAYSTDGCPGGWYPIHPRGVVCLDRGATLDLEHPTLRAMRLAPALDNDLPYTYARVTKATPLSRQDGGEARVRAHSELERGAGLAVVGSWHATDELGERRRLGLTTTGHFVRASDLRAAKPSSFRGMNLSEETTLPVGFIVKRGVHAWRCDDEEAEKLDPLEHHAKLPLTGRFRTVAGEKFWALADGRYVRHRDATVVRKRDSFPDFAADEQKWIDISIITGTLVLYQGQRPLYATLVSVGRDRLGDPAESDSTARGVFEIQSKYVTWLDADTPSQGEAYPLHDLPWVLGLSNGQRLLGAYWHNRFGIEHSSGDVQLSVADAAHLWRWATPTLPSDWHAVLDGGEHGASTRVVIRK